MSDHERTTDLKNVESLELATLRRRSDPPCDGGHDSPSPTENNHNDVFKASFARRLEADGSEDCNVQSIPTELTELVKQVEEYAVLTGAIPVTSTPTNEEKDESIEFIDDSPPSQSTAPAVVLTNDVIVEEAEHDERDVNDNDPLLGDSKNLPICHRTPSKSPKRHLHPASSKWTADPDEYHFQYEFLHQNKKDDYDELYHRLSTLDEGEFGYGHSRKTCRKHGAQIHHQSPTGHYSPTRHKSGSFSSGKLPGLSSEQNSREIAKLNRVAWERDRFWKMTSFRQGTRHSEYKHACTNPAYVGHTQPRHQVGSCGSRAPQKIVAPPEIRPTETCLALMVSVLPSHTAPSPSEPPGNQGW